MSQINPFGGYAAGGTQALRAQAVEKDRQVRRIRRKSRNSALEEDAFEPGIDNPDALTPIQDRQPPPRDSRRRNSAFQEDTPHLDVTG